MVCQSDNRKTDAERCPQATLDALSDHVAVLDAQGSIAAVNKAWREFPAANSSLQEGLTEGANYFDVCAYAKGEGEDEAHRFAAGLRLVIDGKPTTTVEL